MRLDDERKGGSKKPELGQTAQHYVGRFLQEEESSPHAGRHA